MAGRPIEQALTASDEQIRRAVELLDLGRADEWNDLYARCLRCGMKYRVGRHDRHHHNKKCKIKRSRARASKDGLALWEGDKRAARKAGVGREVESEWRPSGRRGQGGNMGRKEWWVPTWANDVAASAGIGRVFFKPRTVRGGEITHPNLHRVMKRAPSGFGSEWYATIVLVLARDDPDFRDMLMTVRALGSDHEGVALLIEQHLGEMDELPRLAVERDL